MKIINLSSILLCAFATIACNKDVDIAQDRELTLMPSAAEMNRTRASGDTFFALGDQITLAITDGGTTTNYIYSYNNTLGTFAGINAANTYHFYIDDQMINTITTSWPTDRTLSYKTDQRLDADFKLSDYMKATITNVMATKESVPIEFIHENAKVVFVLFGQNVSGLKIESLVVNIGNVGYWAHIDPVSGNAELILKPGNVALNANEIAGRIKVSGRTGSVTFLTQLNYTLVAGTSYVVALTPHGDDMHASISIGGWGQNENGVAVPVLKQDGFYQISNEAQLFAIAQLIKNYKPDGGGVNWPSEQYKLTANIVRNVPLREWIPLDGFTGVFNYDTFTIEPAIVFSNDAPITR